MTFETPLQPVPARGLRAGVVLGALVVATIVSVWQPWSAGSTAVPDATPNATPGSTPTATRVVAAQPPPRPIPTAPPYVGPVALPTLDATMVVTLAPDARFRARWSIVALSDDPEGVLRVTQLPMLATSGFVEGRSAAEVCSLGRLRTAVVALMAAGRYRFIGIAAPPDGVVGPAELSRLDGTPLAAFEVVLRLPAGTDADIRLFATADVGLWGEGAYRILAEDRTGRPHFLYVCTVGPSLVDGT